MSRKHKRSPTRLVHRWLGGLVAALVLVVVASGIVLQHPQWLGPVPNLPLSLAADPDRPGHLWRGTHWGVEASGDGGTSWREVPMLAPPTDVTRVLFGPPVAGVRPLYAMGTRTVVVSRDGGAVWQEVSLPADDRLLAGHLVDLATAADGLELLTSVGQFRQDAAGTWAMVGEPSAPGPDRRRWLHDLHTGHLFGPVGRRVAEAGAWGLLILTVTGLWLLRRNGRGHNGRGHKS